jgi:hypothetical protein
LPTFLTGVPHPLQLYRKGWGCLLPLPVLLFVIPQRSGGICCLPLLLLLPFAVACFVCHSAAQRRNLLFAFAVAVACLFSISSQKTRHLDRSNGQSHRLLRSGEIRFCVRPRF